MIGGALWLGASAMAKEKAKETAGAEPTQGTAAGALFEKNAVVILPGTTLSKSQQNELNEVMRKYDKALYKVKIYENGNAKTHGALTDKWINKEALALAKKGKGTSGWTMQFGLDANSYIDPTPTPEPDRKTSSTDIVKEVTKILKHPKK